MTPELEAYFDKYNELFNSNGYAQFKEEIEGTIKDLSELSTIKSSDELFFRKGQIDAFRRILNYQDAVAIAREQAEETDVQDI
jgi:hypothetical protein